MALVVTAAARVVAVAQFVPDTAFRPPIEKPAFLPQKGPVVLVDAAPSSSRTSAGRYLPFAELLRRDGYVVKASTGLFTAETLQGGTILVIANALSEKAQRGGKSPKLPPFPP